MLHDGWLEGGDSSGQIGGHAHVILMRHLGLGRFIADLFVLLMVHQCKFVASGIDKEAAEGEKLRVELKRTEVGKKKNIMELRSSDLR